jgi:hypothetical protein
LIKNPKLTKQYLGVGVLCTLQEAGISYTSKIFALPGSVATGLLSLYSDSLRGGRSVDRILVRPRFSRTVQNGTGAHPASYTKGADKSLARPGRKKATATEDFDVHISYL